MAKFVYGYLSHLTDEELNINAKMADVTRDEYEEHLSDLREFLNDLTEKFENSGFKTNIFENDSIKVYTVEWTTEDQLNTIVSMQDEMLV